MEKVFKVNRPKLEHDKANYGLGDPITLTAEQAKPLLLVGAVLELTAEDVELAQRMADEEAAALAKQKADEEAAALAQKKADEEAAALEAQKTKDAAAANKGAAKAKD